MKMDMYNERQTMNQRKPVTERASASDGGADAVGEGAWDADCEDGSWPFSRSRALESGLDCTNDVLESG